MNKARRSPSRTKEYRRKYYQKYRRKNRGKISRINHKHYLARSKTHSVASRRKSREKWNAKHPAKQRLYRKRSLFKRFVTKEATEQELLSLQKTYELIVDDTNGRLTSSIIRQKSSYQGDYRCRYIFDILPREAPADRTADLAKVHTWLEIGKRQINK